jgi:hypothetical protein
MTSDNRQIFFLPGSLSQDGVRAIHRGMAAFLAQMRAAILD